MLRFPIFLGHCNNTEQTMGASGIDLPLPRGIHDAESYVIKVSERPGLSGLDAVQQLRNACFPCVHLLQQY